MPRYRRAALGRLRPSVPALPYHPPAVLVPCEYRRAQEAAVPNRNNMAASNVRFSNDSQGFIIIAVLWILAALATLATVYALYVRETAAAFVGHNERLEAQALTRAGVDLAVYQLTATPATRPTRGRLQFRMGSAEVTVGYRPENGRIDLNLAPKELLSGLFI